VANVIDDLFPDTEEVEIQKLYPGSRKRVRNWVGSPASATRLAPSHPIFKPSSWGKPTTIEVVPDHTFEFYRPNTFAKIMGKSIPTLKYWEQQKLVPKPPFRFRYDDTVRNYYNEEAILVFLRLLNDRGQLAESRIDWGAFPDLPGEIAKEWARIRADFTAQLKLITDR
jgi:hypothetical protein